jgi:hypothetical protein
MAPTAQIVNTATTLANRTNLFLFALIASLSNSSVFGGIGRHPNLPTLFYIHLTRYVLKRS